MPRSPQYLKHIVCLESLWDADLENRLSVHPILQLTARTTGARHIYFTCNTAAELRHNLRLVRRKKSFNILVFAFHGEKGQIELAGTGFVSLEKLADMMRRRFAGWIVHFASCGTVQVDEPRMANFVEKTGVAMVTGYTHLVDWTEGAVMDLLLLRWLQYYRNLGALLTHLTKHYPDLMHLTGLKSFPPPASRA
jgi:hypothetical protein